MSQSESVAVASFRQQHGADPEWIVTAPGRVNLIGEHTDYNDGFVLPMATGENTAIALRMRDDKVVDAVAADLCDRRQFNLGRFEHRHGLWVDYLIGVAWALHKAGFPLTGWDGCISSTVPVGSGLSSSAALEMATTQAFSVVSDFDWDARQMALIGQKAENDWLGVRTGIMDQYVSAAAEPGKALLIDCRSLECRPVPLPPGAAVVVMDTMTRRGLVDSAYNERRTQCESAAEAMGVAALRDASMVQLDEANVDETTYRRARHVITENARVVEAAETSDAAAFGALMSLSHHSMRDDFEISTTELDLMVDLSMAEDGCFGARLTGAGFGGAAIALVDEKLAQGFVDRVGTRYEQETGIEPDIFLASPGPGAARRRFN